MKRSRAYWRAVLAGLGIFAASPSADAAIGDNSVGVNIHDGLQEHIDACADLGVEWVRLDGNWNAIEPSNNNYQFGPLDASIQRANAAGLQVFLTLAYTPDWVPRHGDTDGQSGNDIPNQSTEWADFINAAVTHWSAAPYNVRHFGIWNEPNLNQFLEGTAGNINDYVNILLVPGASAIRTACPSCKVLGPDLATIGKWDDYMDSLLSKIPTSTFDIVTQHIYHGFTETGSSEINGDLFKNALDQQRFLGTPLESLTRRSTKALLDKWGWAGEVWISETGYEADPPGDANKEQTQATYVTRVLEEQLLRKWYTNTFFYEVNDCGIDQPGCTIDGFGLMRPTAGTYGNRSFPSDFRLKPAFGALKGFIKAHPEIIGSGPKPICADGIDNDGDGFVDTDDRGCNDALDTNEADDPPRNALYALPANKIVVDGNISDFGPEGWIGLPGLSWRGTEPLNGNNDLAVRAAGRFGSDGLYIAIEVTDDQQDNNQTDPNLWQADSVQLAFDVAKSGGLGYDMVDDHEINFALVGGSTHSYRFHGPAGAQDSYQASIVRSGQVTTYEVFLPSTALPGINFAIGEKLGFSFLVNEADGAGRVGWMEWTPGIGQFKAPYYFGEIVLTNEVPDIPDAGTGGMGGANGAGGAGSGGGGGSGGNGDGPGDSSSCGCRFGSAGSAFATWIAVGFFIALALRRNQYSKRS